MLRLWRKRPETPAQPPIGEEILILGESHSTAVARAVGDTGIEGVTAVDVRGLGDDENAVRKALSVYRPRHLVLAFGGTEYNIIGLIEAQPKFDFVWPPFAAAPGDRQIVPSAIIEKLIERRVTKSARRAIAMRAEFGCPAHVMTPPPPFLHLDDDARLPAAFSPLLDAGVAPAELRRKLYAVQCHVMTRLYAKHGIELIPAPAEAQDENGFLLRKFWSRDPTHGSRRYGKLVADYLKDYLNG